MSVSDRILAKIASRLAALVVLVFAARVLEREPQALPIRDKEVATVAFAPERLPGVQAGGIPKPAPEFSLGY